MTEQQPHSGDSGPLRSIGAAIEVLRHEFPDLHHSTLRFLEREGLVQPDRTGGGHRLYSAAHISRITQIRRWQAQGYSLDDIRLLLTSWHAETDFSRLAAQVRDLMVEGNFPPARQAVISADEQGTPLTMLLDEVLGQALVEIGHRWEAGKLLVAQEREASLFASDLIAELARRHTPIQTRQEHVIAATVPGEFHELGLRIVCTMLLAGGWHVHWLGASFETSHLVEAIRQHQPVAVLLSARHGHLAPQTLETIRTLRHADVPRPFHILIGGALTATHYDALLHEGAIPLRSASLENVLSTLTTILQTTPGPSLT